MHTEPPPFYIPLNRRRFRRAIYLASAGFTLPGFLAEALGTTAPPVTQGPYYPLADDVPLDDDNDLVQLNDNLTIASDGVFSPLTAAEKALLPLNYTAIPGTTTGEQQATFDFQVNLTPTEPVYPVAGGCVYKGVPVAGPSSTVRYKISFPAYTGYEYEVYGNPTLDDVAWRALPFSLTQTGTLDRNRHVATSTASLDIFVNEHAANRCAYKVSFRPVGSNFGTP